MEANKLAGFCKPHWQGSVKGGQSNLSNDKGAQSNDKQRHQGKTWIPIWSSHHIGVNPGTFVVKTFP
jgi:hypothetical protein